MPVRIAPLCVALLIAAPSFPQDGPLSLRITVEPKALAIDGNISTAAHESLLVHAAAADPYGRPAEFNLTMTDGTPAGWTLVTELAIRAAVFMEHGTADMNAEKLRFEGSTPEPERLQNALDRLDAVMLPGMEKVMRVVAVSDRRDPFEVLCRRQFFTLTRNNRIEFVRGGDSLRQGAQPALDRLVELLADCPMLEVSVTGHTDSAGDEGINRQISRARAESVVTYLVDRGIAARRLQSAGAGSEAPRLPEDSQWARRLNRRVEFSLSNP